MAERSLDAGGIGWYQCILSPGMANRKNYSNPYAWYTCGDRVWFTSSSGQCVDPYGHASAVAPKHFQAIKDR